MIPNRAVWMMVALGLSACGGGGAVCTTVETGGQFCIPDAGVAPAGQPLTIQIIDVCTVPVDCGGRQGVTCLVAVDAGTVTLSLSGQRCPPLVPKQCTLACGFTTHTCTLPALAEGDYTIATAGVGFPVRTLAVRADAGMPGTCTAQPF